MTPSEFKILPIEKKIALIPNSERMKIEIPSEAVLRD
jgi:hypothetical protein